MAKKTAPPKLDFSVPNHAYESIAKNQRDSMEAIAVKLDNELALTPSEAMFAAAACRAVAKQIPLKQKRKRGAAPRIDGSLAAIQAASGLSYAQIAAIHSKTDPEGITEQAVGRAVERNGRDKAAKTIIDMKGVTVTLKK